jgi:predicted DNA-binding protein
MLSSQKMSKALGRTMAFFLEIVQYGCQNIQNFKLILDLKEHLRKNTEKKTVLKTVS